MVPVAPVYLVMEIPERMVMGMDGIVAVARTDDWRIHICFDCTPYFQEASAESIVRLAREGWRGCEEADMVVYHMAGRSSDVDRILAYLDLDPRMGDDPVGFECSVDSAQAVRWLRQNRPEVYQRLEQEGLV